MVIGPVMLDGCPEVYGALTFSSSGDATVLVLVGEQDECLHVHPYCWIPETWLNRFSFNEWHKQGYVRIAPAETIDHRFIAARIHDVYARYQVIKIVLSRLDFSQLRQHLPDAGFDLDLIRSLFRELEEIYVPCNWLKQRIIAHGNHPILSMSDGAITLAMAISAIHLGNR
jgi:phage terminase large subunit-like protein